MKKAFHAGMTAAKKNETTSRNKTKQQFNNNEIKFSLHPSRNAGTLDQHLTKKGDREMGNYLMAST